MRSLNWSAVGALVLLCGAVWPVAGDDVPTVYPPTRDSLPQAGVPPGATFKFDFDRSAVFPGSTREITVYIPAAYTAQAPACVYVGLDGLGFEAATVFDNLIARHDLPVLIAVGIAPGTTPSRDPAENPRFGRSAEFDDMSDRLARFVLDEVLPEVARRRTPGGLAIRLSTDPNDRAVGGASTGGVGAFTLAWQRPDSFRRVFTAIGTFVDMRGGDRYPAIVRKTEPKPLRVFMQDGANDQLTEALGEIGDWWLGNQTMYSALRFSGYQVDHVWGEDGHSPRHATQVFPDAMRWLWKGWPQPVGAGESQNAFLKQILLPGEEWQPVASSDPHSHFHESPHTYQTRGPGGRLYKTLPEAGQVWLTTQDGRRILLDAGLKRPTGIALSPDGLWLAVVESQSPSRMGLSYRVEADGTVRDRLAFYQFEAAADDQAGGATGWVMDREGRLYGATQTALQVFDRNGRVRALLPLPITRLANPHFGGENLNYLYVSGFLGDGNAATYRRKLKVSGTPPDSAPLRLPPLGPG